MKFDILEPQQIIVDHLRKVDNALIFAGMGISKTAAVLSHLNDLFLDAESIGALVVAPLRVSALTWPAECRDWDPFRWMRVVHLRTAAGERAFLNGTAQIYLLNYESLHHLVSLVERRKGVLPYDTVVWDEITRAKSPGEKFPGPNAPSGSPARPHPTPSWTCSPKFD